MSDRKFTLISRVWMHWIRPMVIVIAVVSAARSSLADWYVVPTGSMKPNIVEGDRVLVNKLAYDLKLPFTSWSLWRRADPARADVVVFYAPGNQRRMIKRVAGLPGDTVELRGNRLVVNGQVARYRDLDPELLTQLGVKTAAPRAIASEDFSGQDHAIMTAVAHTPASFFAPVIVPEEHYFVLGDNRDGSADSRHFGFVHRDGIVGQSRTIVLSLDPDNAYLPRRGRFFRPLR